MAAQEAETATDPMEQLHPDEVDEMIAVALDCPCVADLKQSACGQAFVEAFKCYHKSNEVPKGLGCVDANLAFADCLRQHPEALESLQKAGDEGAFNMPAGPPASHTRSA